MTVDERAAFEAWWNNDENVGGAIDGSEYKAHAWAAWRTRAARDSRMTTTGTNATATGTTETAVEVGAVKP